MKLTVNQKAALDNVIESAPKQHLIMVLWWIFFNTNKVRVLIDGIERGMHWKAAYNRAKNTKLES